MFFKARQYFNLIETWSADARTFANLVPLSLRELNGLLTRDTRNQVLVWLQVYKEWSTKMLDMNITSNPVKNKIRAVKDKNKDNFVRWGQTVLASQIKVERW